MEDEKRSPADILSSLICLKAESNKLGSVFNINFFCKKHGFSKSFVKALSELNVFKNNQGWLHEGLIDKKLISEVIFKMNKYSSDFIRKNQILEEEKKSKDFIDSIKPFENIESVFFIKINKEVERHIPRKLKKEYIEFCPGVKMLNVQHLINYNLTKIKKNE